MRDAVIIILDFFPIKVLCYLQGEKIWVAVLQN